MKLRRRLASMGRSLQAYRARTLLAMLSVAVGVAAVILSRAIGDGARRELTRAVESLGTHLLVVKPLQVKRPVFRPGFAGLATTLTESDCEAVAALPSVAAAAPAAEGKVRVKSGRLSMKATLRGTTAPFLAVRNFAVAEGRCFNTAEERAARRVVVVGARVNRELGQRTSLVGRPILIGDVWFEVVGVLREKGTTPDGANEDDYLLVPVRTAQRRVFNDHWLTAIYLSVTAPEEMDRTAAAVVSLLRRRHREQPGSEDFAVQNTAKVRAFQQELTASLSRYATWLAGIALLIGGFGITALMYVTLRERYGEIGLRMAVGAEVRDILLQFLLEAAATALAGWGAGCVLAATGAAGVAFGTALPLAFPISAVLLSLAMAVVTGLAFGALPARAAARIPPLQALTKR